MTNNGKAGDELQRIGEAIDESILNASAEELREELASQGLDADKVVAEMDAITQKGKIAGAKMRLEHAKDAVKSYKARQDDVPQRDRTGLRIKLQRLRAGGAGEDAGVLMAARKGKQLSERDEEGTLDDLAQLEGLEAPDPEATGE